MYVICDLYFIRMYLLSDVHVMLKDSSLAGTDKVRTL